MLKPTGTPMDWIWGKRGAKDSVCGPIPARTWSSQLRDGNWMDARAGEGQRGCSVGTVTPGRCEVRDDGGVLCNTSMLNVPVLHVKWLSRSTTVHVSPGFHQAPGAPGLPLLPKGDCEWSAWGAWDLGGTVRSQVHCWMFRQMLSIRGNLGGVKRKV